jgi:hypothetical protein
MPKLRVFGTLIGHCTSTSNGKFYHAQNEEIHKEKNAKSHTIQVRVKGSQAAWVARKYRILPESLMTELEKAHIL